MADNVLNAIVNHFVGDGHRLFRVAGIIIFNDLQLVTFDPTLRVNIGNRLLSTGKLLVTVLGHRARHRANHGNFDIFRKRGIAHNQGDTSCQQRFTLHVHPEAPHYYGFLHLL